MRNLVRRIIQFGTALLWIAGLVGLATLPEDWGVFVERAGGVVMLIDRDTLLFGLFTLTGLGLAFTMLEPVARRWLAQRRKGAIEFAQSFFQFPRLFRDQDSRNLIVCVSYYVVITNNRRDSTIKNARIEILDIEGEPPVLPWRLPAFEGGERADIQPGQQVRFLVGQQIRDKAERGERAYGTDPLESMSCHDPSVAFYVRDRERPAGTFPDGGKFTINLAAYADDVEPRLATVAVTTGERSELHLVSQSAIRT